MCFFCLMFFCFWLFIGFPCFFVCSFHFPAFSSQFSVLSLVFHLFSLFFLHVPSPQVSSVLFCFSSPVFFVFSFHFATFSSRFSVFSSVLGSFPLNSLHVLHCFAIFRVYSCFADCKCFFNFTLVSLHFAFVSCNFEILFFQLAICWSHFDAFRAGFTEI